MGYAYCPLIDPNAKDSARFQVGTTEPLVAYHEGNITLNKFLDDVYSEKAFSELGKLYQKAQEMLRCTRLLVLY